MNHRSWASEVTHADERQVTKRRTTSGTLTTECSFFSAHEREIRFPLPRWTSWGGLVRFLSRFSHHCSHHYLLIGANVYHKLDKS